MASDGQVLIVSTIADVATDDVVRCLAAREIPHVRINTEDYPFSRTLTYRPSKTIEEGWLLSDGERIPIPTAVWYRRLRTPAKPADMDEGIYHFCLEENRAAFLGSIMALNARWMSRPTAVWQAEYKPFQLALASKLGLSIPQTIITNDPEAIRTAFHEFGNMIIKPARSGHVVHNAKEFAVYTSRVLKDHLDELESARLSPSIYQELIPKRFDVRVTIVGRKIFAAAIDSQSEPSAVIDWRCTINPYLPHHRITLPERIADQLFRLMDALHLAFGAIDLIQTPSGDYLFLEVNPNGQWLWLDDMLDFGISDSIAEWLGQPAIS
jgi:glutathione synthase/RimK-type ligase-like ATP-grasp enzyme